METQKNSSDRIEWIDYMKVVGMFFIIYGHMFPRLYISQMLSAFFVPVFFAISGYLSRTTYELPVLIKKISVTIFYYITICTINYFINNCILQSDISFPQFIRALIIGDTNIIETMWFVYTLIFIRIIHNYIIRYKYLPLISIIICFSLLIIFNEHIQIINAFVSLIISLPFFEIGYYISKKWNTQLINKHIDAIRQHSNSYLLITLFLYFVIWNLSRKNGYVNFFMNDYGNSFVIFITNTLTGIYATFLLSIIILQKLPKTNKFFTVMSYGNIITLGFHLFFIKMAQTSIGQFCPPHFKYIIPSEIIAAIFILLLFFPANYLYYNVSHKKTIK